MSELNEYRVVWIEQPFNLNAPKVIFVEAESQEDAMKIGKHHIEKKYGIVRFKIDSVTAVPPLPHGCIKE